MTITTFPINTVVPTASIIASTASGVVTATDVQTAINQLAALASVTATFTPVLRFGGASTGLTYTTQSGNYVKIGKLVMVAINIVINSNGTSTGNATITGLPFTAAAVAALACSADNQNVTTTFQASIDIGGTQIDLFQAGGNPAQLTDVQLVDTAALAISGTYISTT